MIVAKEETQRLNQVNFCKKKTEPNRSEAGVKESLP